MSEPVPKHLRNRRRAYDDAGREIPPPTIGSGRAKGETTAYVGCHACGRHLVISTDGAPDDLPFPDIALHLRCRCGSKRIWVMMDMMAHYDRMYREGHPGGGGALPENYRVEAYPFLRGGAPGSSEE